MNVHQAYFDGMFAERDDPWGFRSRWYEERKRAMTMACLPARRFANAFEPGCAIGELTALLAQRCGQVVAWDGAERAIKIARHRLDGCSNVAIDQAWVPGQWPSGSFDLIVISELAYFLSPAEVSELCRRITTSLRPGGTVLGCHWRRPIEGFELTGDRSHALMHEALRLPRLLCVLDEDLRLEVWSGDARSVGTREGLS